jgi:hypothetical protein
MAGFVSSAAKRSNWRAFSSTLEVSAWGLNLLRHRHILQPMHRNQKGPLPNSKGAVNGTGVERGQYQIIWECYTLRTQPNAVFGTGVSRGDRPAAALRRPVVAARKHVVFVRVARACKKAAAANGDSGFR